MSKFTAFVILVVLRIMYHPADAKKEIAPFADQSPVSASTSMISPVKFAGLSGFINKQNQIMNGSVVKNETAGSFENKLTGINEP